jgi:hypothetical protein
VGATWYRNTHHPAKTQPDIYRSFQLGMSDYDDGVMQSTTMMRLAEWAENAASMKHGRVESCLWWEKSEELEEGRTKGKKIVGLLPNGTR